MTACNFLFDKDQVFIYMDTLAISSVDRTPLKVLTKVFPLPHLRSVMCGTGNLDLILKWYLDLQGYVYAENIEFVANIAQERLQLLNKDNPNDATCTIYMFGYVEEVNAFKGYVFRSTKDFSKEEFPYSAGFKPETKYDISSEIEKQGLDNAFIKLMEKQKQEDDIKEDRVGIGGEIHRLFINKDTIRIDIVHRFDDYETDFTKMFKQ